MGRINHFADGFRIGKKVSPMAHGYSLFALRQVSLYRVSGTSKYASLARGLIA